MPHPECKIGRMEFGRDQIDRTIRIEEFCFKAKEKLPDSFKLFYPYLQIHEYCNARLDLINDKDNKYAGESKDAMVNRINDTKVLDLLDELINEAYGLMQ